MIKCMEKTKKKYLIILTVLFLMQIKKKNNGDRVKDNNITDSGIVANLRMSIIRIN